MKAFSSLVFATLVMAAGVYLVHLSIQSWIELRSIPVFIKGFPDVLLRGAQAWLAVIINGSLSLALILGGFSIVLDAWTSKDGMAVMCKALAGLLFLCFVLFYGVFFLFVY